MSKNYIDATPKVYFLHSLRNAHLPNGVRTALGEFIDNSLGEASGDADNVTLVYNHDNIAIIDDGVGMDDLSQMLTLGDSQNRLSSSDIGNFGFGSKVGALYLGWFVEIHTVNKAGEYRRAKVDWREQENKGSWQVPYDNKVLKANRAPKEIRKGGTMVVVRDRHSDRKWQWGSLASDLAHTYRPALDSGKSITLVNAVRGVKSIDLVDYVERDQLVQEFEYCGEVNGKPYTVVAGERVNGSVGKSGVHIAYGHRIIETTKTLPDTTLPSTFYAMIKLGSEWKKSLGSNKTTVAIDRDELLSEVLDHTRHIIESIKEQSQEIRMDLINANIAQEISAAMSKGGEREMASIRYWEPSAWFRKGEGGRDPGEAKKKDSGLEIRLEDLNGQAVWNGSSAGGRVLVELNRQVEYVKSAYDAPLQPSAAWAMVASALADIIEGNPEQVKLLDLDDDDKDLIINKSGAERRQVVLHRILSSMPDVKEPTSKEIQTEMENN